MAHLHSDRPRASFAKQLANFTNTCAGLDLTLRLIQAVAQIGAEVCVDSATVTRLAVTSTQLALARRYLRFFSFIDCFERAYGLLVGDLWSKRTMSAMLELLKVSCLGLYLLLENLTMLHDMNIWLVPWYTPVLIEANKFLFYATCLSIMATVGELMFGSAEHDKLQNSHANTGEKREGSEKVSSAKPGPSTASRVRQMVVDSCDITIPGSFLGWIPLGDLGVGMAVVASTVLVWGDVWARVQQ